MKEFEARLENWRRVVLGSSTAASACCASWAKWYVALRTSEAPPPLDVLDEKFKPLRGIVSADQIDGWLVEAAWRQLGDFNDREALKLIHVYGWAEDRIRRNLVGVRGPHVRLVVARARNNLETILKKVDALGTIRLMPRDLSLRQPTICLPGCPVPTVEMTLP